MFRGALNTLSQAEYQWFYLALIVLTVIICTLAVFLWLKFAPKKRKRKRKHHGHGRINPTRAETGGLPEARPPGEPPLGL